MKKNCIIKVFLLFVFALAGLCCSAQSGMEEYFYESGKIKVVVTVAAIVLVGLFIYIFSLERRLRKLENRK